MDSNEDDRARIEKLLKEGQGRCIICLEEWPISQEPDSSPTEDHSNNQRELINRLMPCNHLQCNSCFVNYQVKDARIKCPVCQLNIEGTSIINCKTMTESKPIEIQEYFSSKKMEMATGGLDGQSGVSGAARSNSIDDSHLYESFDHQFFEQEVKKLLDLRTVIEQERFHSRRLFGNANQATDLEYDCLKQIEQRLYDLQDEIDDLIPFDSKQRIEEFHQLADSLTKIRNGRFDVIRQDVFGDDPEHQDQNGFGGYKRFDLNDFLQDDDQFGYEGYEGDIFDLDSFYRTSESNKNMRASNGSKNGGGRKSKKQQKQQQIQEAQGESTSRQSQKKKRKKGGKVIVQDQKSMKVLVHEEKNILPEQVEIIKSA